MLTLKAIASSAFTSQTSLYKNNPGPAKTKSKSVISYKLQSLRFPLDDGSTGLHGILVNSSHIALRV
jgi:hypothetical protein